MHTFRFWIAFKSVCVCVCVCVEPASGSLHSRCVSSRSPAACTCVCVWSRRPAACTPCVCRAGVRQLARVCVCVCQAGVRQLALGVCACVCVSSRSPAACTRSLHHEPVSGTRYSHSCIACTRSLHLHVNTKPVSGLHSIITPRAGVQLRTSNFAF